MQEGSNVQEGSKCRRAASAGGQQVQEGSNVQEQLDSIGLCSL